MTNKESSYLQYLPPALWRDDPKPPAFSLGQFLLVFEQILTGLEEDLPAAQKGYRHASLEQTLDQLHKLYNPLKVSSNDELWTEQWLDYLASWVGLELQPDWDQYQKRKLINDAVNIYNLRGLKRGLLKHLEIYVTSTLRPRIAVDTGETVFRVALTGDAVGHANVVSSGPPILHPLSVEIDRTSSSYRGRLIVGDAGAPDRSQPAKLWRLRPNGEFDYQVKTDNSLDYLPLYDGSDLDFGDPVLTPVGIADDPLGFYGIADAGSPTAFSKILRLEKDPPHRATLVWRGAPMVKALDLMIDPAGNYIVLDRGNFDLNSSPEGQAQILVIDPEASPGGTPSGAVVGSPLRLTSVINPTALALHPDGDYFVADIGDGPFGLPASQTKFRPAEIYRIDQSTGAVTPLLADLPEELPRPVFPTSLHIDDPDQLLILDYGVKARRGDAGLVEPALIWRLSLPPAPPNLSILSKDISYVTPTDMTKDLKSNLIVVDQGDSMPNDDWRAPSNPYAFGVVLHFAETSPERLRAIDAINDIVAKEKPAGTRYTLKSD